MTYTKEQLNNWHLPWDDAEKETARAAVEATRFESAYIEYKVFPQRKRQLTFSGNGLGAVPGKMKAFLESLGYTVSDAGDTVGHCYAKTTCGLYLSSNSRCGSMK